MKGKAWKFQDDISTDDICPGRYFHLRSDMPELAKHVLEDSRPGFASEVKMGDFIVAGKNFGLGSSREHAPIIIKLAGVSAVLARSFARIFYRNAINVGLPVIICDTDRIDENDELDIDFEKGIVRTPREEIRFPPLIGIMRDILNEGGLVNYIQKHGDLDV